MVEGQGPNAIPAGFEPGQRPVASEFSAYYERAAGMRLLGRPMGDARLRGGLVIQYFEKGRLELHPDALEGYQHDDVRRCGPAFGGVAAGKSTRWVRRWGR
ncbi:MAG: hypothetical protein EBS89_12335 [Proteobacteria bacterium]|nr:hypothetical protein [Pseudomonadota bacterium]